MKVQDARVIGQATLRVDENNIVTISNIGTSGQDGVEIDVRLAGLRTLGTFMDWQWWDPNDSLPIGAMFQSQIFGTVGGFSDHEVGHWSMIKTGPSTYDSTLDFSLHRRQRLLLAEQDGTIIGEIPNVPEGAAVVMRVDPGVLDPEEPFQQAWIVGKGTEEPVQGGIPLPPGMEVFCGDLFECEYHGWSGLSQLGWRIGGEVILPISTDPNETIGILAVLGDGSVRSNVEEITTLRLTFANIPEFQIRDLQLLVVPEPSGLALLAIGFIAPLTRSHVRRKSIVWIQSHFIRRRIDL
jgi:hypothetical protein